MEDGVTSVGNWVFSDLTSLETVILADSVTSIGAYAFSDDWNLTEINLGSGVTTIETEAFYNSRITQLSLPAALTNLADGALLGMYDLENITVAAGNPSYTSVDGVLYTKDGTTLVYYPAGRTDTTFAIPAGVTTVAEYAFSDAQNLTGITMPGSVESVGDNSFPDQAQVIFENDSRWHVLEDGTIVKGVEVPIEGTELYSEAFAVLDLVNQERAAEGLDPLVMDTSLLETAMQRAKELVLYYSHTRPSGYRCFTANDRMIGENAAWGQRSAESVVDAWMNSEGHRQNILGNYSTIGVGCFLLDGDYYWVQCFGQTAESIAQPGNYADQNVKGTAVVAANSEYYVPRFRLDIDSFHTGDTVVPEVYWNDQLVFENITVESSDPSVCVYENGVLRAVSSGTAILSFYYTGYPEGAQRITITVDGKEPAWWYTDEEWDDDWDDAGSQTASDLAFVDVSTSDYYYNPVRWAVQNGITAGTSATTFSPNDWCTRAQTVTFLYASAGRPLG